MLLFGALRLAADRRGGKLGRRPDGSFLARPPTHTVGHFQTVADGVRQPTLATGQELPINASRRSNQWTLRRRAASHKPECAIRNRPGLVPAKRLNKRAKFAGSLKPSSAPIRSTGSAV